MFDAFRGTLDELDELLDRAAAAAEIFGDDVEAGYRRWAKVCHPDRFPAGPEQDRAAGLFRRLTARRDAALALAATPPRRIRSPSRTYQLLGQPASGDLADVYTARAEGSDYVLKIARVGGADPLLAIEARRLERLAARCGDRRYREYLPRVVETFTTPGADGPRRVNVFAHRDGFYTLEAIRRRYPAGLDARHLAWIFKRMLAVLGFARVCGVVHGAVLPPHVLLHAENHGLLLVDWTCAVQTGGVLAFVPTAYRDWYPAEVLRREPAGPAADIYLAAKCLIYAAGGDPVAGRWPGEVPRAMRQFVDTCLFASPRMRPQDAWDLHEEFDALLVRLFGPPKYHRLAMS